MDLVDALLRTEALRLAPPGQVFWYTSGTVGPYYINTHFLYGGPEVAAELLRFIDASSRDPGFHDELSRRVRTQLTADDTYRAVIEALAAALGALPGGDTVDWVSGGARRDWFFSLGVALHLELPHLYLHKDNDAWLADGATMTQVQDLGGRRTAHVADLVTEASSYVRNWIPAIRDRGGELAVSANVVDRAQGGMDVLRDAGVEAAALLRVDEGLFAQLRERGLVDARQHEILVDYFGDPTGAMRRFLQAHPEFLQAALAADDERTAQRARLLVDQDLYGLGQAEPAGQG